MQYKNKKSSVAPRTLLKNGGKIEIDYYDADDREALMDALRSIGNRLPRKNTNNK